MTDDTMAGLDGDVTEERAPEVQYSQAELQRVHGLIVAHGLEEKVTAAHMLDMSQLLEQELGKPSAPVTPERRETKLGRPGPSRRAARPRGATIKGTDEVKEPAYFAVPDPDTGAMTYWFRDKRENIRGWPLRVGEGAYGPAFPARDTLDEAAYSAVVRAWYVTARAPWRERVMQEIADDPAGCAARFAVFQSRCCICNRALTDAASKVYGVGPECRAGFPPSILEVLTRAMGRAHADYLGRE